MVYSPLATSRSSSRPGTGRSDSWTGNVYQRCSTAPPGGGLLGRFENVRQRPSAKRIIQCDAATPEYMRCEYLKPYHGHSSASSTGNYHPTSDMQETKFHRGFQRRNKAAIQPDAARMERELAQQWARDRRDQEAIEIAKALKERVTFNVLTGEGVGRESEYRPVGKRIVNPFGCMEAVFAEHARDTSNRTRQSRHRFFEVPAGHPADTRALALYNDGLTETRREASILGTPAAGLPARARTASLGVADNFAHFRGRTPTSTCEALPYSSRSQSTFG